MVKNCYNGPMESGGDSATISESPRSYERPTLVDLGTLAEITLGNYPQSGADVPFVSNGSVG